MCAVYVLNVNVLYICKHFYLHTHFITGKGNKDHWDCESFQAEVILKMLITLPDLVLMYDGLGLVLLHRDWISPRATEPLLRTKH